MTDDDRRVPVDGLIGNVTLSERADRIAGNVSARIRNTPQVSAGTGAQDVIDVLANPWIAAAVTAACVWLAPTANDPRMPRLDEPANIPLGAAIGIPAAVSGSHEFVPGWLRAEGGK